MPELDINNMTIAYQTSDGKLKAANNVSFTLQEGETLGIVGESGCGKSTVAKSILSLLPSNGEVLSGEIQYDGEDLLQKTEKDLNSEIRWREISWIAQNAMNALDPVYRVEAIFREVIRTHTDMGKEEAREQTESLLESVNLEPARMYDYAHELSGGQRQRVVIALSLALNPNIIIADEPTTGLDVIVQDNVLDLIQDIQEEKGNSMIFISHDIHAVAEVADRIAVMYAGQIIEIGETEEIMKNANHPYTIGLLNSFPTIDDISRDLITIPGTPPRLISPPEGCRFASRCPFATPECNTEPPLNTVHGNHAAKCHYIEKSDEFRKEGKEVETWQTK